MPRITAKPDDLRNKDGGTTEPPSPAGFDPFRDGPDGSGHGGVARGAATRRDGSLNSYYSTSHQYNRQERPDGVISPASSSPLAASDINASSAFDFAHAK